MTLNDLLDLPAYFDLISRIHGFVMGFVRADWRGANRRAGAWGIVAEIGASVLQLNAPLIVFQRGLGWRGIDVERLLVRHGVRIWDRMIFTRECLACAVERRQSRWAEYVCRRAGVPVVTVVDPRNAAWAARHPIGVTPAQCRRRAR